MILQKSFYARDTAKVAKELLGKILVFKSPKGKISGKIVETEAYYGKRDPASRAYRRKKSKAGMAAPMFREVGTSFVYVVHANALFNVIAKKGEAGGVLIRAVEPLEGIEIMFKNRGKVKLTELCSGPGKLTKAFGITQAHSGLDLTKKISGLWIEEPKTKEEIKIARTHRIGVTRDLKRKLRFYIEGSPFVSKKFL
jgi:DNA-3-methyladenine glycosylase